MLRSMTGYAAASAAHGATAVNVTVKSVNHRFLDLHLRLPPELEPLDPKVRRAVRDHLSRGHVDVTIALEREGSVEARVDRALVGAYIEAFRRICSEYGLKAEADLNAVLKIPGALTYAPAATESDETRKLEELILGALNQALERLDAMRGEEGRAIAAELAARLGSLRGAAEDIEKLRLGAEQHYQQRLRERLAELLTDSIAPERLAQEAAILVERSDITEEVQRMKSHVAQFSAILESGGKGGEAGKRLDFLLQEMGREANTILSKTSGLGDAGLRITTLGLAMKADIEKLREQVQNLQ